MSKGTLENGIINPKSNTQLTPSYQSILKSSYTKSANLMVLVSKKPDILACAGRITTLAAFMSSAVPSMLV